MGPPGPTGGQKGGKGWKQGNWGLSLVRSLVGTSRTPTAGHITRQNSSLEKLAPQKRLPDLVFENPPAKG